MKLTVLVDNNTYIDQYYRGEPALSYYLEDQDRKILFDTGYSDLYLQNAQALGIDLTQLDTIVLSHGHNDHTGGLVHFPKLDRKVKLLAHPHVFSDKRYEGLTISSPMSLEEASHRFDLLLTKSPLQLSPHLAFLGEIPRLTSFEAQDPLGHQKYENHWEADYVLDDSALVWQEGDQMAIITGCSHAGIVNIIQYAKKLTGRSRVQALIGGLHLFDGQSSQTQATIAYLQKEKPDKLYPCHCTSFDARAALHQVLPVREVGVGLTLDW